MSKVCKVTGKRATTGHNVSHSVRRTKRRFLPNLQKKKVMNPFTGKMVTVKVSTSALRLLMKSPKKFFKALGK